MTNYRSQVMAACQAVVLHSPVVFSWFGQRVQVLSPAVRRSISTATVRDSMLSAIQNHLYGAFYCQGGATPAMRRAADFRPIGSPAFVEELSAANDGQGYQAEGWQVRSVSDGSVLVSNGRLEVWVQAEQCTAVPEMAIAPGQWVRLRFPKERVGFAPGFYLAVGNRGVQHESRDRQNSEGSYPHVLRLYWNLMPEGAVGFMRAATSALNRANVPFQLKMLNDPMAYARCDAAVLYVSTRDYVAAAPVLARIYADVADGVRPAVPALTKPLAPGLGLAEDPGSVDSSFGQHRCQLLAEGVVRAHELGKKRLEERMAIVEACFAEEEVSLDAPYLNPGSRDVYAVLPPLPRQASPAVVAARSSAGSSAYLEVAAGIGRHLAQEAVWYRDRCSWLGAIPEVEWRSSIAHPRWIYGTVGPDVYAGTSGIALFLAELYAATGDATLRRSARGAIRQGLRRADDVPPPYRLGFYTGWVGVAFAAARVGLLLDDNELLSDARQLLRRSRQVEAGTHAVDLLSGNAGAIGALLILRDLLRDDSLLEFAKRLGDDLLKKAVHSDEGWSWAALECPRDRRYTGLSHGTAGIGYALLELYAATGDARYRRAVEMAFTYERSWYSTDAGNWPDFRGVPSRSARTTVPLTYATAWCHGAPGIALSRLRAFELLDDRVCLAEASAALRTTRLAIEEDLQSHAGNFSLCHGLAGNAEVLVHGGQVQRRAGHDLAGHDDRALIHDVADYGIEKYASGSLAWPCGTDGGSTPGLMLGLAGIGYFYLRLHDPTRDSLLLLRGATPATSPITSNLSHDYHFSERPLDSFSV